MLGPVLDTWDIWQIRNMVPTHTEYTAIVATNGLANRLHTVHVYLTSYTYQSYKVGTTILFSLHR